MHDETDSSGVIHQSLGYWSSLLSRVMESEFNKHLSPYQVTRAGWAVLGAIFYDGIRTPSGLADFLKIDRAAITRLLDKLEDQSLISRLRSTENKRAVCVRVTPEGEALAKELLQISNGVNAQFMTGLSPEERENYVTIVKKMLANGDRTVGTL